ncbi:hypothetical protein [Longispora albida]|uniref:hypothetical protein n=1 Tax=Longispora albida TaxID=203523 RepID=UPI00035DA127|nr:hypothetical protein [Longispora albida]
MAVEKLSVSLDSAVVDRARRAAEAEGISLSAWLNRAVEHTLDVTDAQEAMAEYIAYYGEPDPEEMERTAAKLREAGFGQPESPEDHAARMRALAIIRGEAEPLR